MWVAPERRTWLVPNGIMSRSANLGISVHHHLTPLAALVSAAAIAVALTIAPVSPVAQHKQKPLAAKPSGSAVGLPVFSSDGRRIGMVVATGIDEDDQAVLVAEIERLIGMGSDAVAISRRHIRAQIRSH